ncbi:SIR2-domain-containing protein [Annulohypoxylon truncatum]|uniref:SIR2-domain-containing protein n=1 Tax=Annulohypoxylon truncatum TaxID=327061 RepID=UPI002007492C|nr:SIR2-domain-containing protein [Annulohypoxylon truncatum]KAI1205036.1 SIR2-domain-containing protein [Annulohypoxylon truncatum]
MGGRRPVGRPRKSNPSEKDAQKRDVQKDTQKKDGQKKPKRVKAQVEVADDQQVGHLNVRPHGQARNELEERISDLGDSWETESLFEDVIEDITEVSFFDDVDAVTPEEALAYREQLLTIGPQEFCRQTVDCGAISAKKLLTAFGIRPPAFLEGLADDAYYGLLTLAMSRELGKRAKLPKYNTVDDAVDLLMKSHNIIVLTGAGISTSLGIPDFRSKETGLYTQLENLGLGINDPQEVFNIDIFREDPTIFYSVAKDILPDTKGLFSPTHAFIAKLQNMGKLLTNYSQNIDNIEANAGISPDKLVQCHGSFATATCQKCGYKVKGDTIFADVKAGKIPRCDKCIAALRTNGAMKRKRSSKKSAGKRTRRRSSEDDDDDDDDGRYDIPAAGVMKPDITFFGEELPDEFSQRLVKHDRDLVDLVVVIGTSLKVAPVSEVVPYLPPHIPQIYISRTPVNHINFDIDLLGDCDVVVAELCRRAGWDLDHKMVSPDQVVDIRLEDGYKSRHVFTVSEPSTPEEK